jgi:uncharacterized protein YndB with AHSA1/START domain
MTSSTDHVTGERIAKARIEADPTIPAIRFARDFAATPEQLLKAHTNPELFVQWNGPDNMEIDLQVWDVRTGGSWRYVSTDANGSYGFHGCFHEVRSDRIVQTFTFDGFPDGVALETITFTDLGDGHTRLEALSLCDSFEGRDMMLASGMEVGVHEGYARLDSLLAGGAV